MFIIIIISSSSNYIILSRYINATIFINLLFIHKNRYIILVSSESTADMLLLLIIIVYVHSCHFNKDISIDQSINSIIVILYRMVYMTFKFNVFKEFRIMLLIFLNHITPILKHLQQHIAV